MLSVDDLRVSFRKAFIIEYKKQIDLDKTIELSGGKRLQVMIYFGAHLMFSLETLLTNSKEVFLIFKITVVLKTNLSNS